MAASSNPQEPEASKAAAIARLLWHVDHLRLPVLPEAPCPYLAGQRSTSEAFAIDALDGETYHALMDRRFRRSGDVFYRPRCAACAACVPIRVPVGLFCPSPSQRRAVKRNSDVRVELAPLPDRIDDERLGVYQRYLAAQHPGSPQGGDREELESFLYRRVVDTLELCYRVDGRLMGVSVVDASARAWSSVYFYFDPVFAARSPGVFSVLWEIARCRELGVPHYYLGYWVRGAATMEYKANYRPHELLIGGRWVRPDQA